MIPHRFDPISATLGVVAVTAGTMVAVDAIEPRNAAWWITLAALLVGVSLVPWDRVRRNAPSGPAPILADDDDIPAPEGD